MKKLLILIAVLSSLNCYSQQIALDSTFGQHGILHFGPQFAKPGYDERGIFCFNMADASKLFVVGFTSEIFELSIPNSTIMTKRRSNGSIDSAYGYFGYSKSYFARATGAVLQPDGKLLVSMNSDYPLFTNTLIRLHTNGLPDLSFGQNGTVTISNLVDIYAIAIQSTGKIIVGGSSNHDNYAALRLTDSGQLDYHFGHGGLIAEEIPGYGKIASVVITNEDRIIFAGTKWIAGNYGLRLLSYTHEGKVDSAFNGTGRLFDMANIREKITAIAGQDGKIVLAATPAFDIDSTIIILRINTDGQLDSSFNGGGFTFLSTGNLYASSPIPTLVRLTSGKLLVIGNHNFRDPGVYIARWTTDGRRDLAFGTNGDFRYKLNRSVLPTLNPGVDSIGNIIISITEHNYDPSVNNSDLRALSISENGIINREFGINGTVQLQVASSDFIPEKIYLQNDDKILYAQAHHRILEPGPVGRLTKNGEHDPGFKFSASSRRSKIEINGENIYGITKSPSGDDAISKHNKDGSFHKTFGLNGQILESIGTSQRVFTIDMIGNIYDLRTENNGDSIKLVLLKYKPNGVLDRQFGTNGVCAIILKTINLANFIGLDSYNRIIIFGLSYDFINYQPIGPYVHWVGRVQLDGKLDKSFGDAGLFRIEDGMVIKTNLSNFKPLPLGGLLIFSYHSSPNSSTPILYATKLNSNGLIDKTFGNDGVVKVDSRVSVMLKNGSFFVMGASDDVNSFGDLTITGYLPNGQHNKAFGRDGIYVADVSPPISELDDAYLLNEKLIVATSRSQINRSGALLKFKFRELNQYCPEDKIIYLKANQCSSIVTSIDPPLTDTNLNKISYHLSGATMRTGVGTASGNIFNTGLTSVDYYLKSDTTIGCSFKVVILDTIAPLIRNLSVNRNILWPADHKYQDIIINYEIDNDCRIYNTSLTVESDEPIGSDEPGDEWPDWQIVDQHHVRLRAENSLSGNGRQYTIKLKVIDSDGNTQTDSVVVSVPKILDSPLSSLTVSANPNPSTGDFFISLKSDDVATIINLRLVTEQGFPILESRNHRSGETIRYGSVLKKGLYFLEARQGLLVKVIPILKL